MTTNGTSRFSYLLIGLGLGAIGGLIATFVGRKEMGDALRERGGKGLDYLNEQAGKLRETADVMVRQGKKLIESTGSGSLDRTSEADKQIDHADRRENLGG